MPMRREQNRRDQLRRSLPGRHRYCTSVQTVWTSIVVARWRRMLQSARPGSCCDALRCIWRVLSECHLTQDARQFVRKIERRLPPVPLRTVALEPEQQVGPAVAATGLPTNRPCSNAIDRSRPRCGNLGSKGIQDRIEHRRRRRIGLYRVRGPAALRSPVPTRPYPKYPLAGCLRLRRVSGHGPGHSAIHLPY